MIRDQVRILHLLVLAYISICFSLCYTVIQELLGGGGGGGGGGGAGH